MHREVYHSTQLEEMPAVQEGVPWISKVSLKKDIYNDRGDKHLRWY